MLTVHNTYNNEGYTNAWPFAAGQHLPFGQGTIAGLGVCIAPVEPEAEVSAYVTSVIVSDQYISATVEVEVNSSVVSSFTLSAKPQNFRNVAASYAEVHRIEDTYEISGWLAAGAAQLPGTFVCRLRVDPSCLNRIPPSVYTQTGKVLYVNNAAYDVPETLGLAFNGSFSATFNAGNVNVAGTLGSGEGSRASSAVPEYSMVESINGRQISDSPELMRKDYSITLDLLFALDRQVPKFAELEPSQVFKVQVANGIEYSSGSANPDSDDRHGGVMSITVDGSKDFPSCYDRSEDEALD